MDSETATRIYSQVVLGMPKEESSLAAESAETSAWWDQMVTEVAALKASIPGVVFDIPSEIA